jgi:hypothetical protein
MKKLCVLLLLLLVRAEFVPIEYERSKMDKYPDNVIWSMTWNTRDSITSEGDPNAVTLITEDYYDKFIVERWSN